MSVIEFVDALLGDERVDLRVEHDVITYLGAHDPQRAVGSDGCEVVRGGRITPPMAEPHVHLDAALLGAQAPNRSGTLREGIANWSRLREQLTVEDVCDRAMRTAEMYASWGTLRIRTHVDTGSQLAVEALIELRSDLLVRGIELQVVAFPQEGILRSASRRAAWERAVELGCDAVGGIPHFERTTEEGWRTVHMAFELAEKHGAMVDFHVDETDDPGSRNLEVMCAETIDRGWGARVVAGHCTAMHSYPNPHAAKVIELVAEAGLMVVTNPLDNVVLQGRYDSYPKRRGLTRVDELWAAGASVGIGHDSVMDPWYRLGTANMMDPAYMLLHVGQLTSEADMCRIFHTLSGENHQPWGGPEAIEQGGLARFLWWPDADPVELLRTRPRPRVFRGCSGGQDVIRKTF
ncbi:MAG: cytosine deaminase [Kiritimatiellia bacterium]|jgi:cytosine deaminase